MPYAYVPHYLATISPTVQLIIIPVIGYMIYRSFKGNNASRFALLWFMSTFVLWIPLSLITDRVSFVYYFFPTVGAICIGMGLAFNQLVDIWQFGPVKGWRAAALGILICYMFIHLTVFLVLSPFTNW